MNSLYIIVFFLCVIGAVVGYFQFTLSSQKAKAEKDLKSIQDKAQADLAAAKSEEEKREIQRKAQIESERVKMRAQTEAEKAKIRAQTQAEKKALTSREAKIKAAEAAVNKRLRDAASKVRNAKNLQNQAKRVKADADKKKRAADAAMARAVKTGKDNDKKLAAEKKRLANDAQKKVKQANARASAARNSAKAEAKKALAYKKLLNERTEMAQTIIGTTLGENASLGYYKTRGTYTWGGEGPRNSSPKGCAKWAKTKGYAAWGFRNRDHPTKRYKNTCFGYKYVSSKLDRKHGDNIHMVGCTYTDLRPDQTVCPAGLVKEAYVKIYDGCSASDKGTVIRSVIFKDVKPGTKGIINVCDKNNTRRSAGYVELKNMKLTGSYQARTTQRLARYRKAEVSTTKSFTQCRKFSKYTRKGRCGHYTWEVIA
jgi:hypothetical protein